MVMVTLRSDVSVKVPHTDSFVTAKAGASVNFSSRKSGGTWVNSFSFLHNQHGVLTYVETTSHNDPPKWLS